MKNLALSALMLCAIAACGASSSEVMGAKTAHYKGDKLAMYNAMKDAVAAKYKIDKSDETALTVTTIGRWYTPEGLGASERGDMRDVPDRSINIVFVVTLHPDGDAYVVQITPAYKRYFSGRPNPDILTPDDPSIPGFAPGKQDALAIDIHDALKAYEQTSVPATVPAGSAPAPAPAAAPAPAPAAPAPMGAGY